MYSNAFPSFPLPFFPTLSLSPSLPLFLLLSPEIETRTLLTLGRHLPQLLPLESHSAPVCYLTI